MEIFAIIGIIFVFYFMGKFFTKASKWFSDVGTGLDGISKDLKEQGEESLRNVERMKKKHQSLLRSTTTPLIFGDTLKEKYIEKGDYLAQARKEIDDLTGGTDNG